MTKQGKIWEAKDRYRGILGDEEVDKCHQWGHRLLEVRDNGLVAGVLGSLETNAIHGGAGAAAQRDIVHAIVETHRPAAYQMWKRGELPVNPVDAKDPDPNRVGTIAGAFLAEQITSAEVLGEILNATLGIEERDDIADYQAKVGSNMFDLISDMRPDAVTAAQAEAERKVPAQPVDPVKVASAIEVLKAALPKIQAGWGGDCPDAGELEFVSGLMVSIATLERAVKPMTKGLL